MARQSVDVTLAAAYHHGEMVAEYFDNIVEPMRVQSITWQLEHDLDCIDHDHYLKSQQERKLP
jgi:hypothetical protein